MGFLFTGGENMWEMIIASSVLISIVLILRQIFRGKVSNRVLYAMWLLVALRLVLPFSIGQSPVSVAGIFDQLQNMRMQSADRHTEGTDTKAEEALLADAASGTEDSSYENGKNVHSPDQQKNLQEKDHIMTDGTVVQSTGGSQKMTGEEQALQAQKEQAQNNALYDQKNRRALFLMWITGAVLILAVIAAANICLRYRLRKERRAIGSSPVAGLTVYETALFATPCLYGVFRPAVYMPEGLNAQITAEERKWILCHEETHYRHLDGVWSALRVILAAVYWFHPFVWVAAGCSKKDAELACDEAVLKNCEIDEKIAYGEMLLAVAGKNRKIPALYPSTAVVSKKKELKKRMKVIVERNHYKKRLAFLLVFCMLCGSVFTFTGCGKDAESAGSSTTQDAGAASGAGMDGQPEKMTSSKDQADVQMTEEERQAAENIFQDFLAKNQKKYPYYAIVLMGENNTPVLLASKNKLREAAQDKKLVLTNSADMFCLVDGSIEKTAQADGNVPGVSVPLSSGARLEKLMNLSNSSSGEWLHYKDGSLYTSTHHSMTCYSYSPEQTSELILVKDIKEKISKVSSYDAEYDKQYFWDFDVSDSVVFKKNKKDLRIDLTNTDQYLTQIIEGGEFITSEYGIVRDGKKAEHYYDLHICDSNARKKSGKDALYVTDRKGHKIWSADTSVWNSDSWAQYYITGNKKKAELIRIVPSYTGQKVTGYSFRQFYITSEGQEKVTAEDSVLFDTSDPKPGDEENFRKFMNQLMHGRLEEAEFLISTCEYLQMSPESKNIFLDELLSIQSKLHV